MKSTNWRALVGLGALLSLLLESRGYGFPPNSSPLNGKLEIYSPSEKEYVITLEPSLVQDPSLTAKGAPQSGALSPAAQNALGVQLSLPLLSGPSEPEENPMAAERVPLNRHGP
jgi:hypothetical protein